MAIICHLHWHQWGWWVQWGWCCVSHIIIYVRAVGVHYNSTSFNQLQFWW